MSDSPLQTETLRHCVYAAEVDEIAESLQTNLSRGLRGEQVEIRLKQHGPNTLQTTAETHWYEVVVRQFTDILILILVVAAIISVAVGEVTDAITIFAIVVLNGALGFAQEWKAERALEALRDMLSPRCKVIRDSTEQEIDAVTLVPGDLVRLETGDDVPADLRLAQCVNLKMDESALTGESVSVAKASVPVGENSPLAQRHSMVWMGTAVTSGRAIGIVVATGEQTEFGRIATLTESIGRETTPLQRKLAVLGKQLGFAAVVIAIMVSVAGWAMGKPLLEMFLTGVSLAVAVVPEGLPAVVTLTMALGIRAMVRRKALLRRLRAAEGLGAATVVCTDKTGTLTQNQMTVRTIWLSGGSIDVTGVGYDPAGHFEVAGEKIDYHQRSDLLKLLETSLHCNHARLDRDGNGWQERGEPTESALVVAAYKAWLEPERHPHAVQEHSFDSSRKRMTIVEHDKDGWVAHIKGAPEVILSRCTQVLDDDRVHELTETRRQEAEAAYNEMANGGLRTLAIARRELPRNSSLEADTVEENLTLLGIVGMMDPPRAEVPDAIGLAQSAGIRVVMITGDSPATALAIAHSVGLPSTNAITGQELNEMDDDTLSVTLNNDVVFARTTPEHKLRIVEILQSDGHIVGMTGDGVNDAPALKKADIGIAMGLRGTDVAKGAADIVLTDDNFSSIVGAIEEGRRQYDNIQKFVRYLLSSNTGEVVAIFVNIIIGGPLILLPVQILWMNLVTDGMTAVALGLEPAEKTVMQRPPRKPTEPVLNWSGIGVILGLGAYIGLATLWLFHHYLGHDDPETVMLAETVAFTGIVLIEKANVLNFRSLDSPLLSVGIFTNPWVIIAIGVTVGLQVCAVYVPFLQTALHTTPLRLSDWGMILAMAAPVFVVTEFAKWFRQRTSVEKVSQK
ncbi:cation-translocating P-type ATPase [Novipirellula herctigrandis]